jgi:Fe-S-cluster containining protein
MSDFPCTGCGVCCKRAGRAVDIAKQLLREGNTNIYVQDVAAFPFPYDQTGRCSQLTDDNKCKVYKDRPLICNIKQVWVKHHQADGIISLDNYYLSAAMLCNEMMKEENVDENFFIQLPDK